jgi:opacity protein-like surface antigen
VASTASAQLYVEGRVGVAIMPDASSNFVVVIPPQTFPATQSFGVGASGGVAVGYGFDFGLRTELNMQVQGNAVEQLRVLGYVEPQVGYAITLTPMVDALYDIRLGDSPFVPFVGGGVGLLYTTVSPSNGILFRMDGSATAFAWEVVGGVAWELSESLAVTLNYRYLDTAGDQDLGIFSPVFFPQTFAEQIGLSSHTVTVGLRYSFARGGGE